ncbi:MAG: transposase [Candidatus Binatia bacterium]
MNRRTWAPRGQTPIQRAWERHDRLSVIGALSCSPRRRSIGLSFQIYDQNVRAEQMVQFLHEMRRQLRRRLIVVWDRLRVHQSAAKRLQRETSGEFLFEWLPAYAPEINPVEAMWSYSKHCALANFVPDDVHELEDAVVETICDQATDSDLKRSYFVNAELKL